MSDGLSASAALILTILFLFFQSLTSVPTWWKYTAELLEYSLKALHLSYSISLQFSTSLYAGVCRLDQVRFICIWCKLVVLAAG